MVPSRVTWPMMNTAVPVALAKRTKAAAHSRSCETPPALASTSDKDTVWIESTTNNAAPSALAAARIPSRSDSAAIRKPGASRPSRSARSPT